MRKKNRRRLFYPLLFLFFIVSPLLIAYSLGYNFNPLKARVEKTGGIFIKSKISRLSIFINGAFEKDTSLFSGGALLTDVIPSTYLLRLEKVGYEPWSKAISVEPEIVTELRNIILVPKPVNYATSTQEEISLLSEKKPALKLSINQKGDLVKKDGNTKKIVAPNINSFAELDDAVFFIDKNGFLAKFNPLTNDISTLGHPGFYLNENKTNFVKSSRGDIAILDASGGLFILDNLGKISALRGGISKISFDGEGEKLLLLKEHSIEILWLADNTVQPFQKKATLEEIFKLASPLSDARWFYGDNAHMVIRTADGIFLTELDGRGGRNTAELIGGKVDEMLTSEKIPNAVFFRKGKTWFKIEL